MALVDSPLLQMFVVEFSASMEFFAPESKLVLISNVLSIMIVFSNHPSTRFLIDSTTINCLIILSTLADCKDYMLKETLCYTYQISGLCPPYFRHQCLLPVNWFDCHVLAYNSKLLSIAPMSLHDFNSFFTTLPYS